MGSKWSSDISSPPNSENICRAPWIASEEPEVRRAMRLTKRSGYSSGQSQDAILERMCDYEEISSRAGEDACNLQSMS